MVIMETIGLFLVGLVGIILFLFQFDLFNPWNGKKQRELFEKHHDWSIVETQMKPKRVQRRLTLLVLAIVWVIGVVLQAIGNS